MPEHPIIQARKDDGSYGFNVTAYAMDSSTILFEAAGVTVVNSNHGDSISLSVRSDRRDLEGDNFYLLRAELVPGKTTWFGPACEISGVFTDLRYRTEEELDDDIAGCPSGGGIYVPKGPLDEPSSSWYGHPTPMIRSLVRLKGRQSA